MKILILHGPNLGQLGQRDPRHYGHETLAQVDDSLRAWASEHGVTLECRQSDHEGELVSALHELLPAHSPESGGPESSQDAQDAFAAAVINPGGYAHSSVAIRDAVAMAVEAGRPVVEVHLSHVFAREEFRQRLLTGAVSSGVISGFGSTSYLLGLQAAVSQATDLKSQEKEEPTSHDSND